MPDDQQLSAQDMSDLREIATHLPTGHPMQQKLSKLLSSQPTQFEKDRTGDGPDRGFVSGVQSSVGTAPSLTDTLKNPSTYFGPSVDVAKNLYRTVKDAPSNFKAGGPAGVLGPLVGLNPQSMRERAEHGDTAGILGEAALSTAAALSPVVGKGLSAARGAVSRAAYSGGEVRPGFSSFADSLQHPTQLPGKIITGAAKKLFPPPPQFPGAPLPSADEFYENRGSDFVNRQAEQEILDRKNEIAARRVLRNAPKPEPSSPFPNATPTDKPIGNAEIPPAGSYNPPRFAAGPPTPAPKPLFGNATATNQVVGNAEVPSFRGPSAPPRPVEYVNKFGSSSSRPTEGLIVRHDSPPPMRKVTYQSAAQSDLLKKVMSGDRDAIAEWDRRSLPRPPGVGFLAEPSAPNIPWGKPR
jgi:hypothetical protein